LLENQGSDCRITRPISFNPGKIEVNEIPALEDGASLVPISRGLQVVLHTPSDGEVNIVVDGLNRKADFTQYILTNDKGEKISLGVIYKERIIRFNGEAGSNYFLYIPSRNGSFRLKVEGATIAYKIPSGGLQLDGDLMNNSMALYFYVPENVNAFSITMSGVAANLFSPDGRKIGKLESKTSGVSRILIKRNDVREGFWKIALQHGTATIVLDKQLPQWIIPDPAHPLIITSAQ